MGAGLTPVVPSPLAEQLAPYQREGVRWMLDKLSRPLCGTPDQRGAPRRGQRRGPRRSRALLPPRCGPWRRQRAPLGAQRPQARPARRPSLHHDSSNTSSRAATRDTPTPASGRSSTRPQRGASSPRTARTASTATSSRPRAAARAWAHDGSPVSGRTRGYILLSKALANGTAASLVLLSPRTPAAPARPRSPPCGTRRRGRRRSCGIRRLDVRARDTCVGGAFVTTSAHPSIKPTSGPLRDRSTDPSCSPAGTNSPAGGRSDETRG